MQDIQTKSTHQVEVVPVVLEKHPDADSLSIVRVFGYTCVVRTEDWKDRPLGAYIPPDSVVPDTEAFAYLAGHRRIKARRFRGVMSMGLLYPAPDGAQEGDDVADILGVEHYEPAIHAQGVKVAGADQASPPPGWHPNYDLDSWYRHGRLLIEGEEVHITEKIHGANARFVCIDGQMHCGSRTTWKKQDPACLWWAALAQNAWLEDFCRANPGVTVYGEVFGQVQDLKYGHGPGRFSIRVFDLWTGAAWMDFFEAYPLLSEHWAPPLYVGPYSEQALRDLIDGRTQIPGADHVREGVVIGPIRERTDPRYGRVKLKAVSADYLSRGK